MSNAAKTQGIHHAGLTVPDLARARAFFTEALGFTVVREVPTYPAAFLSDGTVLLTLWQAEDPANAIPADRKRVCGLHHLALRVADLGALRALGAELAKRSDVRVEFAPEHLGGGPTEHMMFTIEGNVRLELIAPTA